MRIYHFLNEEYGSLAIQNEQLKVGRIDEFNDPFEYSHLETENYVVHTMLKSRRNKANQKFGVICFSKNYTSPVQWAHYSDSHRGMCLGFDVPDEELFEISYVAERGPIEEFDKLLDYSNSEFMRYMLSKKYKHWSYEEEVRLVVGFGKKKNNDSMVFKKFSEKLSLKEVILRFRSSVKKKDIKKILHDNGRNMAVSQVVLSKNDCRMEKHA